MWLVDESSRSGWNAGVTADNGLNLADVRFVVVDVASIATQADADALIAASTGFAGRTTNGPDVPVSYGGASWLRQYLSMNGASFSSDGPIAGFFN